MKHLVVDLLLFFDREKMVSVVKNRGLFTYAELLKEDDRALRGSEKPSF